MLSYMTFAHGIYVLKTYSFWSLNPLSSRLCQNLFIYPKTEKKLSNVERI